jgi:hypothetical protein
MQIKPGRYQFTSAGMSTIKTWTISKVCEDRKLLEPSQVANRHVKCYKHFENNLIISYTL